MKFDETTFISVGEQIAQAIAEDDKARLYCAARERACEEHALLLRRSLDGLVYKTHDDAAVADVEPRSDHRPEVVVVGAGSLPPNSSGSGTVGPKRMLKYSATKFACLRTTLVHVLVCWKRKSPHWRPSLVSYVPTPRSCVAS
jgi:hypothetical protein